MSVQKKLQKDSKLNPLDTDGDGVVDDHELHVAEVEHDLRKQRAQRRMATACLVAMGGFTAAMFFIDISRVQALSDISNLFYITGGGVVAAYMGTTAWVQKK